MTRWKLLRNRIEYFLFRSLHAGLSLLPYKAVDTFLPSLMTFAGCTLGIRKKVALANLTMVYPDKSEGWKNRILSEMWENMGHMAAEVYFSRDEEVFGRMRAVGLEHLERVRKTGRGALVVTAHFGNWELAGRYAAHLGFPCTILIKRQRNLLFDEFTNRLRTARDIETIYKEKSYRAIIRSLRANRLVALAADQDARADGLRMDFLGHPASVHSGPAKIALKTSAPIVGMFCVREKDNSHTVHFLPPILPGDLTDNADGERNLTGLYVAQMEDFIHRYPAQWFWMHRRWKGADKARKS